MDVIGKERYGVFPLRGKLLNVREAKVSQLLNNEEIKNIKQILGLKQNKRYNDTSELRYGGIIILTDSDVDGSHIKGLVMNFIHYFWPSLLKIDGFIQSMATPIVKAWKANDPKKKNPKIFYTLTDYENWQKSLGGGLKAAGWKSKYYKGLGTSDEKEAKEAFNDFEKRLINYIWNHNNENGGGLIDNADEQDASEDHDAGDEPEEDEPEGVVGDKSETHNEDEEDFNFDKQNKNFDAITLAFAKTRANDRKRWLKNYNRANIIENDITKVPYYDFVNKDLIHFSNYDCIRSIPSLVDGFKPGQRKIMFVSMKSEHGLLKGEMKVAQLAGYVSAEAAYHHGEAALQETIIGMAQNFVSSNNINLLNPLGNFGFRKQGGKDAASPRYIFTQLNQLVPYIFRKEDDKIHKYVEDDGYTVEPEFYAPIIPMVLVNGSAGIGTGFSSNVPCYNPIDIMNNLRLLLDNKEPVALKPWYRGFTGNIVKLNDNVFRTSGVYEVINETTIKITELPLYTWTEKYNSWLETLVAEDKKNPGKGQIIDSIKDDSGNNTICFTIKFMPGVLQKLIQTNKLEKTLKLYKNVGTSNMHLYNSNSVIQKFSTISDILKSFYSTRLSIYEMRKEYYMKILENDLNLLKYKIQFLKYVINGKIIVWENKKAISKEVILNRVAELNFPKLSNNAFAHNDDKSYSYITNIKFFDITPEEMAKLEDEYAKVLNEYDVYKNTPVKQIWLSEIDELEAAYNKWLVEQDDSDASVKKPKKTATKKVANKGPLKVETMEAKTGGKKTKTA
jgi:DNA topoisomerase-2